METDGRFGIKVEHHKDGDGGYIWQYNGKANDGQVREKRRDRVLREKKGTFRANARVGASYRESSGSYNVFTDNCQHASHKAYEAAGEAGCGIQ